MNKNAKHPTTARLFEAAYATKRLAPEEGAAALARLINASVQQVTNWEARGVSKEGMLSAQQLLGINATWVEYGTGPMFITGSYVNYITPQQAAPCASDTPPNYNAGWPFSATLLERIHALPPRYIHVIEGAVRAVLADCEREAGAEPKRSANGKP